MGPRILHIDIAIIGGGIAGLWALNRLRGQGYSAVLFEQEALGAHQTIGSQGIIHGGVKFALSGAPGADTAAISGMPAAWRDCLAGQGTVDLRGCALLSDAVYLWSDSGLPARLGTFLASKLLRGRVAQLDAGDFPQTLQNNAFRGVVYRLDDFVLDTRSLVQVLAEPHREAIFHIDWQQVSLVRDRDCAALRMPHCTVLPQRLLLCAGAGNAALVEQLGGTAPAMQLRPLQQVLVKHQYPAPLFAHCLGSKPSPRLTITSHRTADDAWIWYLGGDIATEGARDTPRQLVARAQGELARLLPWVDLGPARWRTLQLDRAEPRQRALQRPDKAFVAPVEGVTNALVAWPTKLSLSPDLGNELLRQLAQAQIQPRQQPDLSTLAPLGRPPLAQPVWETLFR